MSRLVRWLPVAGIAVIAPVALVATAAPDATPRTRITIWATPNAFGGASYGMATPPTGALVAEQREVLVSASGEASLAEIATTVDPASVHVRDLTEPGATISEQRFVPGATTATELLGRRIGAKVTVVTAKGEVAGTLRAVDDQVLVLETTTGLSVLRRDAAQDIRFAAAAGDRPTLAWRLSAKKPGKHAIELVYRVGGLAWAADYLAVLDGTGQQLDFSARATIKNSSGGAFDAAEVTLVGADAHATRFTLPQPVSLRTGDQVELMPSRFGAKARQVAVFEAPAGDMIALESPNTDCTSYTGSTEGASYTALEIDVPAQTMLPAGRVRLFRRKGGALEIVGEDQLAATTGVARIKTAAAAELTGERTAATCNVDERARTLREKVELKLTSTSSKPLDIVVRETMWRWSTWKVESEDHKGQRALPQIQEYRVRVPARGTQSLSYTVLYTW